MPFDFDGRLQYNIYVFETFSISRRLFKKTKIHFTEIRFIYTPRKRVGQFETYAETNVRLYYTSTRKQRLFR